MMVRLALFVAVLLATCLLALQAVASDARPHPDTFQTAPQAPQPTVHVFLVAGQSNSVGYNTDPFTADDAPNERIWQLAVCAPNRTALPPARTFLNLSADPLEPCTTHSPHVGFGRSFARALLPSLAAADVVLLVPAGISGTGFVDRVWTAYVGSGFVRAVERMKATWRLLKADQRWQQYNVTWSGVLWHQGEADAGDNANNDYVNTSYYLNTDIIPMIHALRNTSLLPFTSPSLPFMAGQLLPSWLNNASHTERLGVGLGLGMLTQYVPYTGFADSAGLLGDPVFRSGASGQVIHFTARSQRILGKRYYAAYQAALVNYPEQPPTTNAAHRTHATYTTAPTQQPTTIPAFPIARAIATTPRTAPPQAATVSPAIGVCMSGLEDGNKVPGKPGVDYGIPAAWEYEYFASKHLTMVRLPFKWERIQPTLGGELDAFMVSVLKSQLAIAAALNMTILLDCHNYARYGSYVLNGTTGPLTSAMFADLWLRMATAFAGSKGLHGYDLQNEPHTMSNLHVWPQAAQAAITAIRTVDPNTPIYVEGNEWSGAQNWQANNPDFPLSDPSDRLVYSTHCYLDRDGSGTHFDWQQEVAHGVTVQIGVQRMQSFLTWKAKHNVSGHLGEMGAGFDDAGWFEALDLSLQLVRAAGMEMTYWGAGPFFLTYPMGVDVATVQGRPQDKRQTAVLSKYAQSPMNRDAYWLSGPSTGRVGSASANFTLDVRAYLPTVVHFKCYDGVNVAPFYAVDTTGYEFNYWTDFTYTAMNAGAYEVFCVNDADWVDAPAIAYTAS